MQPVLSFGRKLGIAAVELHSVPPDNCNPRSRFGSLEAARPVIGERLLDFRLRVS